MKKIYTIFFFILLLASCDSQKVKIYDLDEIIASGELTIITINSSTSYFIYKDEPMGYDYDLAKKFCDFHNLKLNVKVAENSTRLIEMLEEGEGDLIAYPVPVQNSLKDSLIYCGLEQVSRQVLVQRSDNKDFIIIDVPQLIGKEVHVKPDTKYYQRLKNLDAELGNGIIISDIEKDTVTVEDLIRMVANKTIDYTIADEYIAKLNKTYYKNIDISMPISFDQRSSWAVRKNSPLLAEALNTWFSDNYKKPTYLATMKKYFEISKGTTNVNEPKAIKLILKKGDISVYDDLFKKYQKTSGIEWQLLASIAYQESRFRPDLSSWAGAVGLMGLMPRTAAIYKVTGDDLKDPEMSIMAGSSYLKYLIKIYTKIADPEERIKFALAAYNGGSGHIEDARALATKHGKDPNIWYGHVEKYVELKSKPEYYTDSVVKYGYLRGTEVVNYVREVTENWKKFSNIKSGKQETEKLDQDSQPIFLPEAENKP